MKTITVVFSEVTSPLPPVSPWPLIYTVDVDDVNSLEDIRWRVAHERFRDLLSNDPSLDGVLYQKVFDGIVIHFAFEGDLQAIVDFRS